VKIDNMVFISGIVGTDSSGTVAGKTVGKADMAVQAAQVLGTIETGLDLLGSPTSQLTYLKAFVTDWKPLNTYYSVGEEFLRSRANTAGSTVMSGLAQEGLVLEIEGIAVEGVTVQNFSWSGTKPLGPYNSSAVRAGDLLFVSGCSALDTHGVVRGAGSIRTQTRVAMENLRSILASAGFNEADVIKTFVTLYDPRQINSFSKVYGSYFQGRYPATTVVGGQLPVPGLLVSIEAVASKGRRTVDGAKSTTLELTTQSRSLTKPLWPYSYAARAGNLVYISGLLGVNASGRITNRGDIGAQTSQCLAHLNSTLELLGLRSDDIVKTTVYITDWREYQGYNEVYGDYFEPPYYPARSTVQMGLPLAGALIQMDAIAVDGASSSATILDSDRTFWKGKRT
jgi:2-iminobutanoate/2-iminopropanoate deaminase